MKLHSLLALALVVVLTTGGCVATYRAQLEKKIPRVDATKITVKGHTIYGVSGELTETGIEWKGTTKTVQSSSSRVDSPLGGFTVEIEKAKFRP
jgi:hypothetical protein